MNSEMIEKAQLAPNTGLSSLLSADNTLGSPTLSPKSKLSQVLKSTLKKRYNLSPEKKLHNHLWDENYYHLKNMALYQRLAVPERKILLAKMSNSVLVHAYYLEKISLTVFSKLILLAETTEEKISHAMVCGDEARHLSILSQFIEHDPTTEYKQGLFFNYLNETIQLSNRAQLLYIAQIFLKSMGTSNYSDLIDNVLDQEAKQALKEIFQDETYHQNCGKALFQDVELTNDDSRFLIERVATLIEITKNEIGLNLIRHFTSMHGQLFDNEIGELLKEANVILRTETKLAPIFLSMRANEKGRIHQSLQDMGVLSYPTMDEMVENLTFGLRNL